MRANGGGNAHQRAMKAGSRNLIAKLSDQGVAHTTPLHNEPAPGTVTDGFPTDRVLTALGTILAFVGLLEVFPLWLSMIVYISGFFALLYGLHRWTTTVKWRPYYRASFLAVVALLCVGLLWYPVTKQYKRDEVAVTFKDSVEISWWRKAIIRHQLRSFHTYLVDLGFPDYGIPPLEIAEGTKGTSVTSPPWLPIYRGNLTVGSGSVEDGTAWTYSYCEWMAVRFINLPPNGGQLSPSRIIGLFSSSEAFCDYITRSFWDKPDNSGSLSGLLWSMRERFGRDFTDKLAAYTLRSMVDDPKATTEGEHPDTFFCRYLKISDSVIDSGSKKWPEILAIFREKNNGLLARCPG